MRTRMLKKIMTLCLLCVLFPSNEVYARFKKVFEEQDGFVMIDATKFSKQTMTKKRKWKLVDNKTAIQILPDTRKTHSDKLINGENFSDKPGEAAVVHYRVKINNPGKYYVWLSALSTGSEDNGVHVGIDGEWPETGKRMQWCDGKKQWTWASKQRTAQNHCGICGGIYLNINESGEHELMFSMREDGFKMNRIVLSKEYDIMSNKLVEGNISMNLQEYEFFSKWDINVEGDYSVPYYQGNINALAINTVRQPTDKWCAAKQIFSGEEGVYDMSFISLLENDGECYYKVIVDGIEVMNFRNPRIFGTDIKEYTPYTITVEGVSLKNNSEIMVLFKPDSNNLVPEKDAFAFARARWRDLIIKKK